MMVGRFWLGLILLLFCLPLFVGLGNNDLIGDEAAHSFSVSRILETGDWLVPRSSPSEDFAFVEKPPLKFWIVAAPIRLGVFPLNEFTLRFWDAFFASIAFLYIFAIGSRMAGPVCGAVAVLVCFTYTPLLIDHGVRGNNMEATLLLSYCGGVFHYLGWAAASDTRSSRLHAFAVAWYFILGFLTKFVAVLFLPAVLLAGTLLIGASRRKALREWRIWAAASALALALVAPWFVFATVKFGRPFWNEILINQVFTRLTAHLDPAHLQPWSFYWMTFYTGFLYVGSLVFGGMVVLLVQTIRRRWMEGAVVLLWFVLPMAAMSTGTSKLAHYAYPYVPPLALGAGYLAALALMVLPAPLDRALWAPEQYATGWMSRTLAALRRPAARKALITIGATAVAIGIGSLAYGQIRLRIGDSVIFKSSGVLRPAIIAIVCGVLAGESRRAARVVVPLLVAGLLPLQAYRDLVGRLDDVGDHRMRSARDCILESAGRAGEGSAVGIYVSGFESRAFGHEHYYYFRGIRPWEREDPPSFEKLFQYLYDPAHPKPVLLPDTVYQDFMHWIASADAPLSHSVAIAPPRIAFGQVVLVLPGPYAVCRPEVALA